MLKDGEKQEPLGGDKYIIQSENGYRFGVESVALAKFALEFVRKGDRVFDLCSGCGIVGITIALATECTVVGAELNRELWDMSVRSCELNNLKSVNFFNVDVRDPGAFARADYDAVVCNPPFFKSNSKPATVAPEANVELTVTFEQIAAAAKSLLKTGGALYLVHTASRLDEVLETCRAHSLMPKHLLINPNGKTFLLRAVRGGRAGLTVEVTDSAFVRLARNRKTPLSEDE